MHIKKNQKTSSSLENTIQFSTINLSLKDKYPQWMWRRKCQKILLMQIGRSMQRPLSCKQFSRHIFFKCFMLRTIRIKMFNWWLYIISTQSISTLCDLYICLIKRGQIFNGIYLHEPFSKESIFNLVENSIYKITKNIDYMF